MQIKFTQAARKHRVGHARALSVMNAVAPVVDLSARGERRLSWVGADDRGLELEIVAVEATDAKTGAAILLVLHVMPTNLRKK